MEYKKILVPVDGSPEGGRALDHAVYLAKLSGASLCLLHVADLNRKMSLLERAWTGGGVPPEMKEKGYAILAEHARRVPPEINLSSGTQPHGNGRPRRRQPLRAALRHRSRTNRAIKNVRLPDYLKQTHFFYL